MHDEDSLTKRLKRYTQVSTTLGGLGLKLLGEKYLGLNIDRDKHASALSLNLGELRGPLVKVAQLLATIPGALPEEYVIELRKLQTSAPPMGWPFVRRRMSRELGPNFENKFQSFEKTSFAAASLGQVHHGLSLENIHLAIKLQYPDMHAAVEADINQLKTLLSLYGKYDNAIQTSDVFEEVKDRLREELDYILEASRMKLYGLIFENNSSVHIPEPIASLSTNRLLTMTYLKGEPLLSFKDAPLETRNTIAINLFKAWYIPFYHYGIIHGDPHPGNYTVRDDLSLNLLDFGCVRIFNASFVGAVIDLYRALQKNDEALAISAFEAWGFKNLSKELIEALTLWARFLYAPLLDNQKRTIRDNAAKTDAIYGKDIALNVHQKLKNLGGITPPREFVFIDRAALGLGSVFMHLNAEINWHELFESLIQDFNAAEMTSKQAEILKKAGL